MSRRKIIIIEPQAVPTWTFRMEFWVPGLPRPWARPEPGVTAKGQAYGREGPKNRERQDHVYRYVEEQLRGRYPHFLPYLPVARPAAVWLGVSFYFPTAGDPERPHTDDPDTDNLQKNVGDALVGVLLKRPTLIYQNDSQINAWMPAPTKEYWSPTRAMTDPSYPQEVGTRLIVQVFPPYR